MFEGPMKRELFPGYVEQCLAPTLNQMTSSFGHLASLKVPGAGEAIEAPCTMLRYLPQYSPDLRVDSGQVESPLHLSWPGFSRPSRLIPRRA
jgi:hypothetical protein